MNDLKKGDLVKVKETNEELEVIFSSTMGEKFYILAPKGTHAAITDSNGIKFYAPNELDYTDKQKEWFMYEAQHHEWEQQEIY